MGEYSVGIQTKNTILDSCKGLFYNSGFTGTSYEEICSSAGVNRGLIPYYFKSKANIAGIIYKEYINQLEAMISRLCGDDKNLSFVVTNALLYELAQRDRSYGRFYDEIESSTALLDFNLDLQYYIIRQLVEFNGIELEQEAIKTMACMGEGVERELIHGIVTDFLQEDIWRIAIRDTLFVFDLVGIDIEVAKATMKKAEAIYTKYAATCNESFAVGLVDRASL